MFTKTLLVGAFAALAAAQSAVLTFTNVPNPITDGEPQAILYATNDTQSPVTIILRQGTQTNLQTVQTLTSDSTGGQFIWTPPLSLPNGNDYALEIRQPNGEFNYFGPFTVQGASPDAVASASSYASSSASAGASSTSSVISSLLSVITANSTATATGSTNATMIMTGTISAGTGTTMSRNATMSSPTLTRTTAADSSATASGSGASDSAGFQGTASASGAASTDNAAVANQGKSALAFVVGAVAAVLYVQ